MVFALLASNKTTKEPVKDNILLYLWYHYIRTINHTLRFTVNKMFKLVITILLFCSQTYCYDKGITFNTYRNCRREVIVAGDGTDSEFLKFHNFTPIQNLIYNNNGNSLKLRFYFQGRADFSVGILFTK